MGAAAFGSGKDIAAQKSGRAAQQVDRNGRRRKVPAITQLVLSEARPIGNNSTAANGSAREQHDGARTAIGPLRAIDASGSSKLNDGDYHGVLPRRPELALCGFLITSLAVSARRGRFPAPTVSGEVAFLRGRSL
jgi:hypothetical protein